MAQVQEAPGELALVRAFINTMDYDDRVETFATPEALLAWFAERGLMDPGDEVGEGDRSRAIAVREALRDLALANDEGTPPPPAAVATLNEAAGRAPLVTRFDDDGQAALEAGDDCVDAADVALARILAIVYRAMQTGEWSRLKACRNDTCRWAFYDRSKNRSRHWCSMAVCGSQVKARAYRQRRKSVPGSGS
jgi:predicted RNA-binding Zn ribbon-like protein